MQKKVNGIKKAFLLQIQVLLNIFLLEPTSY